MSETQKIRLFDDPASTVSLMRRLLRENVLPYRGWILSALFFMALMAVATGFTAWLMDPVITHIFTEKREDLLWPIAGAVLATFFIKGGANYVQATLMARLGLRIVADNQNRLFAHLIGMDLAFFHDQSTGRLLSRFTNDVAAMRVAVSNALTNLGKDLLTLLGLIIVMFIEDWQLAFLSFFVFPVAVIPVVRIGRRMRRVSANTQQELGLFTTTLEQCFQGIRVVKAYAMESYEKSRIAVLTERIFKLSLKAERTRALSGPIMETLGGIAVGVVILYGGYRVITEGMSPGAFFAFLTALLMAYEPMKRLANLNASLQAGLAGAQRMFTLLDMQSDMREASDAKPLEIKTGAMSLRDLHFSYPGGKVAIDGVSIEVAAGETVALVGPSGAGKSTLLNLIPRFHDLDAGHICIDDQDVRSLTFASLRGAIALVSQEIMLFDDTVRANIAYGRRDASDADIETAARHAAAHEFIKDLPDGYDTMVGEQGIKLSGGQRQRLAIARAILKNAPILLLDEATSALDTESERKVQAALDHLMAGRTTVTIAHRLSTVIRATKIYVLDGGRVVEQGTHDSLLAQGGAYAKLHTLQFAGHDGEDG